MRHIVIITHTYDKFKSRTTCCGTSRISGARPVTASPCGGDCEVAGRRSCDHARRSLGHPGSLREASERYPVVLNGGTIDIRKRHVSRNLVRPNDGWLGPVVIKTDLNSGGTPEVRLTKMMRKGVEAIDLPPGGISGEYRIVDTPSEVPASIWENPGFVVERFLPERDERGYWLRIWMFLGDRGVVRDISRRIRWSRARTSSRAARKCRCPTRCARSGGGSVSITASSISHFVMASRCCSMPTERRGGCRPIPRGTQTFASESRAGYRSVVRRTVTDNDAFAEASRDYFSTVVPDWSHVGVPFRPATKTPRSCSASSIRSRPPLASSCWADAGNDRRYVARSHRALRGRSQCGDVTRLVVARSIARK